MSQPRPQVTIVGLGRVGTSIGLALRQAGVASKVIGHDRDSAAASRAKKLEAVDKTDWLLVPACAGSDLVILSIPVDGIRATLEAIGPALHPGCVVMDTASLKAPVLRWADELLPDTVHFVGSDPILGAAAPGGEAPRADLFHGRLVCLMPAPRAGSEAVKLCIDLVTILGGRPLFYDALEHDGLLAAAEHLPALLSLALMETASAQPTWRELRKLAGPAFQAGTEALDADPAALAQLCALNRDNLVRWIDALAGSLADLRERLAGGEDLAGRLEAARRERAQWLRMQASGDWGDLPAAELPPKPSLLQPLLGGLVGRKPRKRE